MNRITSNRELCLAVGDLVSKHRAAARSLEEYLRALRTRDDVGDVECVEFTGKEFLLTYVDPKTKKTKVMKSADGLEWEALDWPVPRHVRLVNGVLYSSSYPPTKHARSLDGGKTWEPLANDDGWHYKAYSYGPLAGGVPPKAPTAAKPGTK